MQNEQTEREKMEKLSSVIGLSSFSELERFRLLTYDQRRTGKRLCRRGGDGGGSEETTLSTTNSGFGMRNLTEKKTIHVTLLCD